jgi:hypothetical protein
VKLFFSTSHFGFLRNFEFAIRELARRGHEIRLFADRRDTLGGAQMVERFQADFPDRISAGQGPKLKDAAWQPLASALRLSQDYWRYLHPRYDGSPKLKARARSQAPGAAATLARLPLVGSAAGLRLLGRAVRAIEHSLPVPADVMALLEAERPDLLLVTPLLYFGTHQVDYVRAARRLGIRSVLCVGSWDHLTTKGLIHEVPDRVIVWNDAQRQEAREIHGVPPERVTVTGAQAYDHWFTSKPSTTREAFCARAGLDAARPYLLYLCSSPFITPHEVGFVQRWLAGLRLWGPPSAFADASADRRSLGGGWSGGPWAGGAAPELRSVGVLVRPHPQNSAQWEGIDLAGHGNVAIWPRGGANPVDADARADYFDSMFFSAAVVGVNTSALIESGIVGRMVYSVLDAEFAGTQEGTLHFRHLQSDGGGLLHTAPTLEAHYRQLAALLADLVAGRAAVDDRARRFVESFIRPRGIDVAAAGVFADAIEEEGRRGPVRPVAPSRFAPVWHAALRPLALGAQAAALRRREEARRLKEASAFRDKDAPEEAR